jgi:hypothetical protein
MGTRRGTVFAVIVALTVAGCGSSDPDAGSPDAPTGGVAEVRFDGSSCTGPSQVAAGNRTFVLTDTSGDVRGLPLGVRRIAEGRSYDEVVAAQDAAGGPGTYVPHDADVLLSVRSDFTASDIEIADNQRQYHVILEPGPHALVLGDTSRVWLCGSFEVVAP